jgi:hypothetical protein
MQLLMPMDMFLRDGAREGKVGVFTAFCPQARQANGAAAVPGNAELLAGDPTVQGCGALTSGATKRSAPCP